MIVSATRHSRVHRGGGDHQTSQRQRCEQILHLPDFIGPISDGDLREGCAQAIRDSAQERRVEGALLNRAAPCLAINRCRFERHWLTEEAGCSAADGPLECHRIKLLENSMKGRLTGRGPAFDAEPPQPLMVVVRPPFGNRTFAARAAEHGHTSEQQNREQFIAAALCVAKVGDFCQSFFQ